VERRLLLASGNAGKLRELRELLQPAGWRVLAPAEVDLGAVTVLEGSRSYLENATAKAVAYARASGLPALADDSGLEVDALDGGPGVLSARFGGPAASNDRERCALLLRRLDGLPRARRGARFRAVLVLALPGGATFAREGAVDGRIAEAKRGASGFGYDPVFELPGGRTMAELGEEKQRISHRARALSAMMEVLEAVDDPQHPPAITAGARR
jgi:XTP/dITP diphosphohydrolase